MTTLREAAQQALEALDAYSWEQVDAARTALRAALAEPDGTSVQQSMQTVREGFGRTMSYLTEVFGVSRQTLYNWLSGEKAPSPEHEGKIHQLEVASQRFMELGFKPSPSQLTRTLAQGKSFLELLAAGGDGAKNADKLVNLVQRGEHSRARLEALARTVMLNQTSHDTAQLPPQRPAEPVQDPVAWIHTDPNMPRVKFLEWRENEPGYRGDWIKTPLYAAPPQRKPLTEEEIQAAWDSVDMRHPRGNETRIAFARAIERAHEPGDNDD